jgi:hypothetical protein
MMGMGKNNVILWAEGGPYSEGEQEKNHTPGNLSPTKTPPPRPSRTALPRSESTLNVFPELHLRCDQNSGGKLTLENFN